MQRSRFVNAALAGALLLGSTGLAACDREDEQDAEEIIDDADKELDKLDTDGKDD